MGQLRLFNVAKTSFLDVDTTSLSNIVTTSFLDVVTTSQSNVVTTLKYKGCFNYQIQPYNNTPTTLGSQCCHIGVVHTLDQLYSLIKETQNSPNFLSTFYLLNLQYISATSTFPVWGIFEVISHQFVDSASVPLADFSKASARKATI